VYVSAFYPAIEVLYTAIQTGQVMTSSTNLS
jgi:hypothetical protein